MNTSNLKPLIVIAIIFAAIYFVSCSKDKSDDLSNEIELIVAKQQIVENRNALIVRELTINNGWFPYYSEIEGFEYEDGYEYRLKVRKITPSKEIMGTYASYELIEELSKEKKTTIFQLLSYTILNNARAEGAKLSPTDKANIENKIKQSSPFNGINSLTFEFTDFYIGTPKSRDCTYKTNLGKSGNCNIMQTEVEGQSNAIYTFDFDGVKISYNYTHTGSPGSTQYLIQDLTSAYKEDYLELEMAQSGIGLKINL